MPAKPKLKPPADPKPIWLQLPPADHQRLREAAAKSGVPMSVFSRTAVLAAVDQVLGGKR